MKGKQLIQKVYELYNERKIDELLNYYGNDSSYIDLDSGDVYGTGLDFFRTKYKNEFEVGFKLNFSDFIECGQYCIAKADYHNQTGLNGRTLALFKIEENKIQGIYPFAYDEEDTGNPSELVMRLFDYYNHKDLSEMEKLWHEDVVYKGLFSGVVYYQGKEALMQKDKNEFEEDWHIDVLETLTLGEFVVVHISYNNKKNESGESIKIIRVVDGLVTEVMECN